MAALTIQEWKDRIRNGQRFMSKFAQSNNWSRYKEYYRHRGFKDGIIPVNLVFSILRSMVPQVYFRNPRVTITARKPGLEADLNARLVQHIDNWLLTQMSVKREIKRMIQDNFFCGIGIGLHGYDSQFGYSPDLIDPAGGYSLSQFDSSGNRTEYNSAVGPGMPWFLRARPEDVVFPWGSTDKESLEWFALRVFRPLQDLKADKKYTNTSDLNGTVNKRRTMPEGGVIIDITDQLSQADDDTKWVELWEIHDVKTGAVKALTMDSDSWLRDEPDDLQVEGGLPIDIVTFNPDPDYIYGVPDARIIEPQLLELNDIRTQAMKHRRINIIKALVREGALSDEEMQKLKSEDVQAFVIVKDDTMNIAGAVVPLNPGVSGILQDLIAQGEVAQGDIRETVGFSRVAQGQYQGKTHVSAAETNNVFKSLNIRLDERRDQIADLIESIVRNANKRIFKYWNQERVSKIMGPDGAQWWIKYTGTQLKDEYDLDVIAEEGTPMDKQTKLQLGQDAARVWAELNQGLIKQGVPIPAEIQRLIFSQFDDTGLDIDRLLAQTQAMHQQGQAAMASGGTNSTSPQNPASPAQAAQMLQGGQR